MTLECEILLKFTQFLASKCSRAFRNAFSKNAVLGVQSYGLSPRNFVKPRSVNGAVNGIFRKIP